MQTPLRRPYTRKHLNLTHRPRIQPPFDQSPRRREEFRCVYDNRLIHRFGEAEGVDIRLFLDYIQCPAPELRQRQLTQIQNTDTLKPPKLWIIPFEAQQPLLIIMLHHMPMIIQHPLQRNRTLHPINIQPPRLRIKHRTPILAKSRIQLWILTQIHRWIHTQRLVGVGVVVHGTGCGTAFGGLGDHEEGVG